MFNDILRKLLGRENGSKNTAKKRLQFALVYDKLEVSDDILRNLQNDIVEVISKYFEIDKEALKLDIRKADDLSALVVNTPILSAKRRENRSPEKSDADKKRPSIGRAAEAGQK